MPVIPFALSNYIFLLVSSVIYSTLLIVNLSIETGVYADQKCSGNPTGKKGNKTSKQL